MSRLLFIGCLTIGLLTPAVADDSSITRLKKGDSAGVFYVTKVAGANDDGVKPGQELCYRCRYGSRPMVMVFTRKMNGKIPELVKTIDAAVGQSHESQLRGLVTFMGDDAAKVKEETAKFAHQVESKHVPLVIAKATKTGPENYKLDDSPVTVVVAIDSQVVATYRCDADAIDVRLIMKQVKQMLTIDAAHRVPTSG